MMFAFVISEEHQYTVRGALESRSHGLLDQVLILSYRDFLKLPQLPATHYIFLDLERLPNSVRQAAADRIGALQRIAPQTRVLNPPATDLTRLTMMGRLHAAGVNGFRVVQFDRLPDDLHYPVFLRRGDDHDGPASEPLLHKPALLAEGERLIARGIPRGSLLVTEYVDARNADGYFEKRSYFRIGDKFFPSALDASTYWVCKGVSKDPHAVDTADREMTFLHGTTDEAQLIRAFEAAGVTYGRADYAIVGGRAQIFEINTNPMVETPRKLPPHMRAYANTVLDRWLGALETYSGPAQKAAPDWVTVPVATAADMAEQPHRLRNLVRRVLMATGQLHRESWIRRPFRAIGVLR